MSPHVQDTSGRLNSLHDLVLDYVNHCAYSSTARILSQPRRRRNDTTPQPVPIEHDAGSSTNGGNGADNDSMDIDGPSGAGGGGDIASRKDREKERLITEAELASIEKRRVILNYILNGAIIRAVEGLNTHFPTVLSDVTSSTTTNGTNGWTSSTSTPTRPAPNTRSPNHSTPVLVYSSHPSHVKLNLQIQSFIESFRNLAPSSPSTPSSSISSLTSSMHMSGHMPNPLLGHPTNGVSHNTLNGGGPGSGVTLTNALTAAQGLHAEAKKLPPDARAIYLQEIKDVGALFAYTDPETSILKGFLDQNRRIALAEQVNLAILKGQRGPAFLTLIAKRTSVLYALLEERGIDPRPIGWEERSTKKDLLSDHWRSYGETWAQHGGEAFGFNLHRFVEETWI